MTKVSEGEFYISRWDKFIWDFTLFPLWRFIFWRCEYRPGGSRTYHRRHR